MQSQRTTCHLPWQYHLTWARPNGSCPPVRNMPNPTCAKQLQSFLGAVNYYSEFLHKSADLIAPLQRLLRAKTPWVWGAEQQTAMDKIRDRLCQLPALHNFDPQRPTIVTTDASSDGLGATLSQLLNGKEVPIAYASHTLTSTERNYATNEREALAVLWALEHWEHFLLGLHFQLRSDHKPLASLIQHTNARKREKFIRWADRLSRFNFTFSYIPGSSNSAADCLSRLPTTSPTMEDCGIEPKPIHIAQVTGGINMHTILDASPT